MITYTINSWMEFHKVITTKIDNEDEYIWRGQSRKEWPLESSLHRELKRNIDSYKTNLNNHKERFAKAIIGRRGLSPEKIDNDIDRWSLGQHFGLKTPLLDWSKSPYVAAYFGFWKVNDVTNGEIAIFGLNRVIIEELSEVMAENENEKSLPLLVYTPKLDENSRIISQSGLFTIAPNGMNESTWLDTMFSYEENPWPFESDNYFPLIRILVPSSERWACLRSLETMNITHSTLFPDLSGVSEYCNMTLKRELENE
jgi:hypothetical protein